MTPVLYISFAVLSTGLNLLSQAAVFHIYHGLGDIYLAMGFGTLNGLILKYVLDKKYIFNYQTQNIKDDSIKFFLYSLMGVVTTILFWAVELGFNHLFDPAYAKYVGATLGLSLGYFIKYHLDKNFVFIQTKNIENQH